MDKDNVIHFKKHNDKKSRPESKAEQRVQQGSVIVDRDFKVYKNDYFEFEIKVPVTWMTLEHNELFNIAKENFNRLTISDTERNKILDAMTTNSVSLLSATPFPRGTKQPYGRSQLMDNPSLNCTAQKVIMHPNYTSSDFMEGMIGQLKGGSMGFKYDEVSEVSSVIISGKRFDSIEGKAYINGGRDTIYTKCYSILKKGYQLLIMTSSISEEGSKGLSKIVNNLVLE